MLADGTFDEIAENGDLQTAYVLEKKEQTVPISLIVPVQLRLLLVKGLWI